MHQFLILIDGILKMYYACIYFHERQKPKYFAWINFDKKPINSRNFIHAKICLSKQRNTWTIPYLIWETISWLNTTDRGDMNTIIKKLKDISQNRHFLISKVESEDIFSALKRVKIYLRLTTARTNIRSLSCHMNKYFCHDV